MAVHQFAFDEGFSQIPPTGGLNFPFTRDVATVDTAGNEVGSGDARFHVEQRLLCGAPEVRVDINADGIIGAQASPVAAGFAADGSTPLLAVYFADPGKLVVYSVGASGSLTEYTSSSSAAAITFPPSSTLYGEDSSFAICQGLLYRICKVTNVQARSTAIIWANLVPPNPSPTTVVWQAPTNVPADSQLGVDRGAAFQHTGYCVFPEDIDGNERISRVWIPFADYVKNQSPLSDIGRFFLASASRSGLGPWTMSTTTLVYQTPTRVTPPGAINSGQHAHNAYVERFGESGLRMIMAVGDFQTRNRVLSSTCDDAANYDTAAWSEKENRHGESTTSNSQTVCGDGNQFVGSAALGKYTEYAGRVIGSDEMIVPLSRLVVPESVDDLYNFTRLYGGPTSSFNRQEIGQLAFVWNTFFVMKPTTESSGPYVAWVCPGNQAGNNWVDNDAARRVVFSPDGLHWGQAWAPNDGDEGQPIQTIADRIFMHSRTGRGLRSIPVPAYRLFRPLMVGVGGTNLLAAGTGNGLIGGTTDTGNTATLVTTAGLDAASVTKPPCMGPIYKCVAGGLNGSLVGIFKLTQGTSINPSVSKLIKVRAWVYPLPWAASPGTFGTETANCLGLAVGLGRGGPVPVGVDVRDFFAASREEVVYGPLQTVGDASGWIPITIDTTTDAWTNEPLIPPPTSLTSFDLALRLRTGLGPSSALSNPQAFLIAFDTVTHTASPYPGYPLPVASGVQPSEQAFVKDFNCSSSWTIKLAGLSGDSARDQLLPESHRTTPQYLATLWQTGTKFIRASMEIGSPTATSFVRFSVHDGSLAVENIDVPAISGDAMFALRGNPVLLAVSRSGSTYRFAISVGGTRVALSEKVMSHSISPVEIRFGDENIANTEQMEWFGGEINTTDASKLSDLTASLQTLDFLTGGVE